MTDNGSQVHMKPVHRPKNKGLDSVQNKIESGEKRSNPTLNISIVKIPCQWNNIFTNFTPLFKPRSFWKKEKGSDQNFLKKHLSYKNTE